MSATPTPLRIAQVVEAVCRQMAMQDDILEAAVGLAIEIVSGPPAANLPGLTQLETKIVRCLIAANGKPVHQSALLEIVSPDSIIDIIHVLVCKIRKKRPDIGRHIETVYGEGYRWTGPKLEAVL